MYKKLVAPLVLGFSLVSTVSSTASTSPAAGDMWLDTTSGTTSMKEILVNEDLSTYSQSVHRLKNNFDKGACN